MSWGNEDPALPHSWLYNLLAHPLQGTLQQELNKQVGARPLPYGVLVSVSPPSMAGTGSGLGTPIHGLTDALLCPQLCIKLRKGIIKLEDALKQMRGA